MGVIHFTDKSNSSDAFRLAIAQYLENLHTYSSLHSRSTSSDFQIDEYNVGAVISSVAPLRRSFEVSIEFDELLKCLFQAWYLCIDKENKEIDYDMIRDHFNEDYDLDGSLNLIIAEYLQDIASSSSSLDSKEQENLKISANLLKKYAEFLNPKTNETTKVKLSELQYKFHDLYTILKFQTQENIERAIILRQEANSLLKANKATSAIAKYTLAIQLDPKNHILYSNRGGIFSLSNNHDNAISDLQKAINLEPNYETAWTRIAFCYLGKGNGIESIKSYVKAIQLAEANNSLPQYLKKLIDSLSYAKQRVLSQGRTVEEIERLIEPCKTIVDKYKDLSNQSRPGTTTGFFTAIPVTIPNGSLPEGTTMTTLPDGTRQFTATSTINLSQLVGDQATRSTAAATANEQDSDNTEQQQQPDLGNNVLNNPTQTNNLISNAIQQGLSQLFNASVNSSNSFTTSTTQPPQNNNNNNINTTTETTTQDQEMPDENRSGQNLGIESILANMISNSLPDSIRSSVGPMIVNAANNYSQNRQSTTTSTTINGNTNTTTTTTTTSDNNTGTDNGTTDVDYIEDYDLD